MEQVDTREFPIVHSKEEAVSPYFVERRNTENWNSSACYKTYAEAHAHVVRLMNQYPGLPVRINIHRQRKQGEQHAH